jgi:hypothetical protein
MRWMKLSASWGSGANEAKAARGNEDREEDEKGEEEITQMRSEQMTRQPDLRFCA